MRPFENLRVLELASVLAGPSVGQFFAELGAQVIKVENPAAGGDVTRQWKLPIENPAADTSAYFSAVNWGKQSWALHLKDPAALQQLYQLIKQLDVVIASYKPGDAEKLGVDFESLRKLNPRLIYGQITGYGPTVNRAGYDAVLQAECGFMHLNGESSGPPTKMPVALIDLLAGHQLKEGLLTALYLREKTGTGQLVEVSLQASAIASLANQASGYLWAGHNPQRMGSEHPTIVPYGSVYGTLDGKELVLAVGDDRQFQALCRVLGAPELAANPDYEHNFNRVRNRDSLHQHLTGRIREFHQSELLTALIQAQVPAGAINDVSAVFADPAGQALLLQHEGKTGLRTAVFQLNGQWPAAQLTSPPALSGFVPDLDINH